jgi:hypothetical protein
VLSPPLYDNTLQDPVVGCPRMSRHKSKHLTEVYVIEGFYLFTEVGSSGRGVLASSGGVTGTIRIVPVRVRKTLQRKREGLILDLV